jgi:hypothetical protein
MRISQDLRASARAGAGENGAESAGLSSAEIKAGMRQKSEEFRESGGEIYVAKGR